MQDVFLKKLCAELSCRWTPVEPWQPELQDVESVTRLHERGKLKAAEMGSPDAMERRNYAR
jgi:hypothetical protein